MIGIFVLFRSYFLRIGSVVRLMLLEIFDESAYARFLKRRRIATSTQAYADFLRETQAHRERRPRCC
jgi:hypothetical protein